MPSPKKISNKKILVFFGALVCISMVVIIGSIAAAVLLYEDNGDDGDSTLATNEKIELFSSD